MRRCTLSRPVETGVYLLGTWPTSLYLFLFRLTWLIVVVILQIFQYWYIVVNVGIKDFSFLVDCMSVAFVNSLTLAKLVIIWSKKRELNGILTSMTTDWENRTTDFRERTMFSKIKLAQHFSVITIGFNMVSVILYELSNFVVPFISGENTYDREFILKMKFPFDINHPSVFGITLVAAIFQNFMCAATAAIVSCLVTSLVFHASGQIEIICYELTQIHLEHNRCNPDVNVTLKNILIKHQNIIDFSNNIESLFTYIALLQMLWNTLIICCLGLTMVISFGTVEAPEMIAKSLVFYVAISFEAFTFCFAGEYLSAKSISIGNVAYTIHWYDMLPKDRQELLILIVRSQNRLTITAGKIMDLSMEGFAKIMKASASYISVLHAMY